MLTAIITIALAQTTTTEFAKMLDVDGDGIIHPMEAASALQFMLEESGAEGISILEIESILEERNLYEREEIQLFVDEFDTNDDGNLQTSEVPTEMGIKPETFDLNVDGVISIDEILEVNPFSDAFMIKMEVDSVFEDYDETESISIKTIFEEEPDFAEFLFGIDANKDKRIDRDELYVGLLEDMAPATFEIEGKNAMMSGTIGASTPFRVMELLLHHPEVKTIIMVDVPGSVDDVSNFQACQMVRLHGLNTHLQSDGIVSSGGTDFFQAGVERTCEKGARFGIHSWGGFGIEGDQIPKESDEHQMYLDFCDEMSIPQSFYWYTLKAAPTSGMHWMTESELYRFKLITSPILE
ncbi:MAG TPA: hypothetical protein EYO01_00420 [Phycisphaerales bacterium]|nr:hypothetical protein [Phycisphaerales bacterium]HIN83929.1 hypothetical protein [Phycisphaerales bacterium]